MHNGGSENISKSQVLSQMETLNEDFRRTNADKSSTPAEFAGLAADCEIEFRLAQKDPSGNCTDGIVRYKTSLTSAADNDIKALSYWNSKKYLNIWVVENIDNGGGQSGGFVAGYDGDHYLEVNRYSDAGTYTVLAQESNII